MSDTLVRLATRGSRLARIQTDLAIAALGSVGLDQTEVVIIETTGDARQDVPTAQLEGQGWFTAEIERALIDGRADCAVHSAKDLPSELAPELYVAAYLERADVRDALVAADGMTLATLPPGSRVATSSPRRAGLALSINPAITIVPMRGNVDTRLRKLDEGEVDALLLACAGLDRLGSGDRITERLDPTLFVPAPAQGAIALEARTDTAVDQLIAAADHRLTRAAIAAERTLMVALGGGCLLPLGAYAAVEDGDLVLTAALAADGELRRTTVRGAVTAPETLGELAAWHMR